MAQLFDRIVTLYVGTGDKSFKDLPNGMQQITFDALKVQRLRLDFDIEKDNKPGPNKAKIEVYNLNAEHRKAVQVKGVRILLSAGYPGTQAQIFSGDLRFGNSEKHGADWITKLECGDAERALTQGRISESFNPGTAISDVIGSLVKAMKIDGGNLTQKAKSMVRTFADGHSVHGLASAELTRLLEPEGLEWSVQDGRIEVLGIAETVGDQVPLISADTGMVGSPEYGTGEKLKGESFLKVKSLLQPAIRPGSKFHVKSKSIDGDFKCRKVKLVGSTHGGDFYSEIEGINV